MSICIHCGASIPKNAECCSYCGQPAEHETRSHHDYDFDREFHSEDRVCSGCRKLVDSGNTICPHCGKRLRYGYQSASIRTFADQIQALESETSAHSLTASDLFDALVSMFSVKLVVWFFISIACHAFLLFAFIVLMKALKKARNGRSSSIRSQVRFIDSFTFYGDRVEVLEGLTYIRDKMYDLRREADRSTVKQLAASFYAASGRLYSGCNEHLTQDTSRLVDTIYFDIQAVHEQIQR